MTSDRNDRCVSECREIFGEDNKPALRAFEDLDCREAVEFMEGRDPSAEPFQ